MTNVGTHGKLPHKKPLAFKRRAIRVSEEEMVTIRPFFPDGSLPLLIEPRMEGVDLLAWAADHKDFLEEKLIEHGGILFRGFGVRQPEDLERFIEKISGPALEYRERSSPRSAVSGNIYTSTDYPPSQPIFLHNENSYQKTWPRKIFFFCHTPPTERGETPIADCRRVYERIDPEIRDRFVEKQWMYVRNFGAGFGLAWQEVFQSSDKEAVEEHCRANGIEVQWLEGDQLRARAVRPAVARHPKSGENLWFNHATFFHVSTLEPVIREALLQEFSRDELPANTYYGDGTEIAPEVMEHLREAYNQETVSFPWERGDLLMLDNMIAAHGRAPFSGPRKILVGMSEPCSERNP